MDLAADFGLVECTAGVSLLVCSMLLDMLIGCVFVVRYTHPLLSRLRSASTLPLTSDMWTPTQSQR